MADEKGCYEEYFAYEITTPGSYYLGADRTANGIIVRLRVDFERLQGPIEKVQVGKVLAYSVDDALNNVRHAAWIGWATLNTVSNGKSVIVNKTRPVEFLLAYESRQWATEVIEVPIEVPLEREALMTWAEAYLPPQKKYQGVAMFAVYHIPEERE